MALITKDGDQAEKAVDAPKIEFPCDNYVIKIVALDEAGSYENILEGMKKHAPEMDTSQVSTNRSSKGRFISYSFRIVATSEQQLADLHKDLMSISAVKMVM
ncbi:YbeD family protein [Marinomonas dokdonensis]|uniref:YbeD family protein n=1 Tax=Marinomonas dokdonensis TaxID=328224 RepID=UPI00405554C5